MNIQFIHKLRLWYGAKDERYKLFFLYTIKVIVRYICIETVITAYVGLVTPGGSFQSIYLMYFNVLPLLVKSIVWGAYYLLAALKFDMFVNGDIIGVKGTGGVEVGWYCIGYSAWLVISVLIACYPGKIKNKLYYVFVSILLIHFLNILRISMLAILAQYDVNLEYHHIVYNFVIYLFVAILFLIYVEYFSDYKTSSEEKIGNV